MSGRPPLVAFIDESGDRGLSANSSDHFILGAVVMPESRRHHAAEWLKTLRSDLGVGANQELSWKRQRSHEKRLHIARSLGTMPFARASVVVSCKRHLPQAPTFTVDHAYMFTFRLLLERLSWLAEEREMDLTYTIAHMKGFETATLREYERKLRAAGNGIPWSYVTGGGKIDRPANEEMLQIADLATSAVGCAFNPDSFGHTERRYVQKLAARLYRGPEDKGDLTSLGMKMHPWNQQTRAAYPWVAAL